MSQYIEITQIISEMRATKERLDAEKRGIFTLAKARAQTERAYKVALRQEILALKEQGYPATLIHDLAKGSEVVAELRLQRDIARELYNSGRDSIRSTQIEASLLQTISKYSSE